MTKGGAKDVTGAVHGQETRGRLSYKMTQTDKVLLWQDSTAAMINLGQERKD